MVYITANSLIFTKLHCQLTTDEIRQSTNGTCGHQRDRSSLQDISNALQGVNLLSVGLGVPLGFIYLSVLSGEAPAEEQAARDSYSGHNAVGGECDGVLGRISGVVQVRRPDLGNCDTYQYQSPPTSREGPRLTITQRVDRRICSRPLSPRSGES